MITTRRATISAAVVALSTVILALTATPVGAQEAPPPEGNEGATTTTVAFTAEDLAVPPDHGSPVSTRLCNASAIASPASSGSS